MATWDVDPDGGGSFTSLQAANDSGSVSSGDTLRVTTGTNACQTSALTISKSLTITASAGVYAATPTAAEATSKARCASNAATQVTISAANVLWEKVAVCPGNNNNMVVFSVGDYDGVVVRNVMVVQTNSGASNCGLISFAGTGTNKCTIYNTGFASVTSGSDVAIQCRTSGGVVNSYNCSLLSASWYSTYFADGGGTVNAYAIVCIGPGNFNTGIGTAADLVTQNASPPGTNARGSVTGVFKNTSFGSEDLNLYGLNGGLLTGVTDRSGTVAGLVTDLAGNSRPLATNFPIDPGCVQIAAGPSILAYADTGAMQTDTDTSEAVSINVPFSNCALYLGATGLTDPSAGDWNGTAMTACAGNQIFGGYYTKWYRLENPGTGTYSATATFPSTTRRWVCAYVLKYATGTNPPALDVGVGDGVSGSSITKSGTTAESNEGALALFVNSSSGDAPRFDAPGVLRSKSTTASFIESATGVQLAASSGTNTVVGRTDSSDTLCLSVVFIKQGSAVTYLSPVLFFNRRLKHSNLRR